MSAPAESLPSTHAGVLALLREGIATSRAQPIASAIAALILAAVCAVVFATTGQAAATEAKVVDRVDQAGSRAMALTDGSGSAHLTTEHLREVTRLEGVEWALGLGPTIDVRNDVLGPAGTLVAARTYFTDLPPAIQLVSGRPPRPGEAIAGEQASRDLALAAGTGSAAGGNLSFPIVGIYSADEPLTDLNNVVLVRHDGAKSMRMQSLYFMATTVGQVPILSSVVPDVVSVREPSELTIDSPVLLAELQEVLSGEVGRSSRRLMALVLGAGLILVAITQYGATAARRRDFGRRRALGASRWDLMVLVVTQGMLAGAAGALVGTGVGLLVVSRLTATLPRWDFILGVPTLTLLCSLAATLPPAVAAARADPVRILRVP